jgi:hypothetical protein
MKRPRGRPVKDPALKRSEPVPVYLTPAELAKLDSLRGQTTRADWLAKTAGVRE